MKKRLMGLMLVGLVLAGCGSQNTTNEETVGLDEYNSMVDKYNALVDEFESLKITSDVQNYNTLLEQYNKLVMNKQLSDLRVEMLQESIEELEAVISTESQTEPPTEPQTEAIIYRSDIDYKTIARSPDDYIGEYIEFTGNVVQVLETNGNVDLRVAIDDDYDKMFYVSYDSNISPVRILEEDNITFKGSYYGIYQYESTLGATISVPLCIANEIILIE